MLSVAAVVSPPDLTPPLLTPLPERGQVTFNQQKKPAHDADPLKRV